MGVVGTGLGATVGFGTVKLGYGAAGGSTVDDEVEVTWVGSQHAELH